MKLITAVIAPRTLEPVKDTLALFGVRGLTITPVHRPARRPGPVQIYRGQQFTSDLEPTLKIELLAADDEVTDLTRVINKLITSLEPAPPDIWITPVQLLVRVRTGEHGLDAL